ncbi:hypothetical protein SAMN05660964_00595 [Thiothrix caldifontis]|uniref:DUF4435 domain-containing protein n=1 Tax=Thiothrix caldifontis TaxID=525918 RepID=A0A1H3X671_9GAMM|nr:hypothetical protein [Thiothrix caldifontis]SDZ94885.1 hypothetical protein SAMN05660964_00595 [Thiothrix caldifontis]
MQSLKSRQRAATSTVTTDDDILFSRYAGKRIVYLESEADVNLYENYWFRDYLRKLAFKPGSDGNANMNGCTAVRQSVEHDRSAGIESYGIVDRDSVKSADLWDLVWETDDEVFLAAKPFGDYINVLLRWEMESYLLEPHALERHLASHQQGRAERPTHEVTSELLQHCDALIPLAGLNLLRHSQRKREINNPYKNKQRDAVDLEVRKLLNTPDDIEPYEANLSKAATFTNSSSDLLDQYHGLLRIIDGKLLLNRWKQIHAIMDDPRYHLAERINPAPIEIATYIDSISSSHL